MSTKEKHTKKAVKQVNSDLNLIKYSEGSKVFIDCSKLERIRLSKKRRTNNVRHNLAISNLM